MNDEEIVVTIDKNGLVTMQVSGVKGSQCEALTSDLIAALGGQIIEHQTTDEYYLEQQTETGELRAGFD